MVEGRVFRALAVVVPLVFVACAAVTGLGDFDIVGDASTDAGPASSSPEASVVAPLDAALPSGGVDAGDAGDASDAVAPHDAALDAPACTIPELDSARTFTAVHLASAPAIDGNLDDWPCGFVALDTTSAQKTDGRPISSAHIAVGWDEAGMYFACRVFDTDVEGTNAEPFKNDACELFIGAPLPGSGSYVPGDNHFVVDYQNLARSYPARLPSVPNDIAE